jgi:hypothetical protein
LTEDKDGGGEWEGGRKVSGAATAEMLNRLIDFGGVKRKGRV